MQRIENVRIAPTGVRLGVRIPDLGAVAATFIAGAKAVGLRRREDMIPYLDLQYCG